ncbi:flagellar biosynthesis protein FlhG [Melioribacter roseus P3M-2]|uniref:Flagellar biosynthesis protein FlhG n=1 Tax=Melioribacter roseus (strain DSM 23840 / JCM 17771 / VKM B-2668 / P3M-2) TaxID=1191523 RepID=I6ZTL7_MELRP|nr:AAA family ATPase [Melioribacter roseus]AFN75379.1 flagellar biosynthesis protein FlhG [Melioribacter roseus P3M-2]
MNDQVKRLLELRRLQNNREGKTALVVSVCSGKGGTGKSFVSLNLAYKLARLNKKVLVVDFDFNLSNLHLLLNETVREPLSDFFNQKVTFDELIYRYNDNLHLIFGDSGSNNFPKITNDLIEYFFIHLEKASRNYDFVFIDSAAGADSNTMYQISRSDLNLIVASPEPTAIMDAYVLIKLITEQSVDKRYMNMPENIIIINKADDKEEGEQAFQNLSTAVRHFLNKEIMLLGVIGHDRTAYKSITNQELLVEHYPNSMAALQIDDLARRFLNIAQMANNSQFLNQKS